MKSTLLQSIKCQHCGHDSFDLNKKKESRGEIREGSLRCRNCSLSLEIKEGILNCIHEPKKDILNEIKENNQVAKKRKSKDDNWLLSLPLSDDFGNAKCMKINEGYLRNVEFAIKKLDLKIDLKGKKVLDIGAGTCWTTNLLAKAGAHAVATDISVEKYVGLESADVFIRNSGAYFERVLCSMDDLPFNDYKFDIVFSNAAVHHSPDIRDTFKEISRVLKKSGLYVQTNEPVCSIFNLSRKIKIKKAKEKGMDVAEGWNENTYTYFDYRALLKKNGLQGRFIFPPSFSYMLKDKGALKGVKGYKRVIGALISRMWDLKPLRSVFLALFPLSLVLFGGSFVLIARKYGKKL